MVVSEELSTGPLAPRRFGHDKDFDGLAEGDGSLHSGLWCWEAVTAVTPSQFGMRRGGGAVCQQEANLDLRRL